MTNPYSPPNDTATTSRLSRFAHIWNAIIALVLIALSIYGVGVLYLTYDRCLGGGFTRPDRFQLFATEATHYAVILFGGALTLLSLTTFAFHRYRNATRTVAALLSLTLAFNFYSMRFTVGFAERAAFFAVLYFPLVVFGCGWPHSVSRTIVWIRGHYPRQTLNQQNTGGEP